MRIKVAIAMLAALTLAGCGALPRGAPLEREIVAGATKSDAEREIAIYPVSRDILAFVDHWPAPLGTHDDQDGKAWPRRTQGSAEQLIQVGDRIDLAVWTTEENSLLTGPGERVVDVSGATVSPGGTIFVPYVGRVRVAGQSVEAARESIQRQFSVSVPDAQVQLVREVGRLAAVEVVDGVARPGSYPLTDGAVTALEVISEAGGAERTLENPRLRLVRGHDTHTIALKALFASPELDTVMRPGDKLIVEEDPRTFLALGATGTERIVRFPEAEVTALEALALAGGINDSRADPTGILVLREYGPGAVSPDLAFGPDRDRVVFAIDLTTPDGAFSANRFRILSGDVVLATESSISSIERVTAVLASSLGLVARVGL